MDYCHYDGRMTSPSANPSFRERHRPNSEAPNPDAPGNSSVESRAKLRETTEIPRKRHLTGAAWCEDKWTMWTTAPQDITKTGPQKGRPNSSPGCHGLGCHPTSRNLNQPWRSPGWAARGIKLVWLGIAGAKILTRNEEISTITEPQNPVGTYIMRSYRDDYHSTWFSGDWRLTSSPPCRIQQLTHQNHIHHIQVSSNFKLLCPYTASATASSSPLQSHPFLGRLCRGNDAVQKGTQEVVDGHIGQP